MDTALGLAIGTACALLLVALRRRLATRYAVMASVVVVLLAVVPASLTSFPAVYGPLVIGGVVAARR